MKRVAINSCFFKKIKIVAFNGKRPLQLNILAYIWSSLSFKLLVKYKKPLINI